MQGASCTIARGKAPRVDDTSDAARHARGVPLRRAPRSPSPPPRLGLRPLQALLAVLLAQQHWARGAASCCDIKPQLCKPLSPAPVYQHEVVAYYGPGDYGGTLDSWKHFDFTKITAIGMFSRGR